MALVTTSVTPTVRLSPFVGLSQTVRERSGIARAEEVHTAYGTWDAAGAGNNRGLIFSWDLDPDYGYILMDCSAAFILSGGSLTMEATAFMEIGTDLGPGGSEKERQYYQLVNHPSRQDDAAETPVGDLKAAKYNTMYPAGTDVGVMAFQMPVKPTALLYPFPGVSAIEIATVFGDEYPNAGSLGYRFYARFLQYDVSQGYNYVVNSPVMTR